MLTEVAVVGIAEGSLEYSVTRQLLQSFVETRSNYAEGGGEVESALLACYSVLKGSYWSVLV